MGADVRVPSRWSELQSTSVLDWDCLEPGMFRLGGRIDRFRLGSRELTLGRATVIHGPTPSGTTAVLRLIERAAGACATPPKAVAPPPGFFMFAAGNQVEAATLAAIEAAPVDGCLLVDAAFGRLSWERIPGLVGVLLGCKQQVVFTIFSEAVACVKASSGPNVGFLDTAELGESVQAELQAHPLRRRQPNRAR